MTRANSLIDDVTELSEPMVLRADRPGEPSARYVEVAFAGGRRGLLDVATYRGRIWADVLRSLRESGQPAYVEVDPETRIISELLLPIRYTVERIKRAKDGLEVELVISQARHYLRRSHPRFDELRKALETARVSQTLVLVTETLEEHELIDVRPVAGQRGAAKE